MFFKIRHTFSCESSEIKRSWISLNFPGARLFKDITVVAVVNVVVVVVVVVAVVVVVVVVVADAPRHEEPALLNV